MDVRCEKCQTEYELDEARLKPGGVTVKCTNCGHMFKIRKRSNTNVGVPAAAGGGGSGPTERARTQSSKPPGGKLDQGRADSILGDTAVSAAPSAEERQWLIRLENGEQKSCRELAMLQQWIVAGVVTRESLISRTGKTWKRLGDITELAQYFTIADEARSQRQQKPTGPSAKPKEAQPTLLGVGASAAGGTILPDDDDGGLDQRTTGRLPARPPTPAPPPPPAPRRPTTQPPPPPGSAKRKGESQSGPLPSASFVGAPTVPASNRSTATWATDGAGPEAKADAGPAGPLGGRIKAVSNEPAFAGRVRVEPSDEASFRTGKVDALEDDDDVLPGRRGSRGGIWLLLMALLVMGAAAGVVYVFVIRKHKDEASNKPPADAGAVAVQNADAAVAPPPAPDAAAVTPPAKTAVQLAAEKLGADKELELRDALASLQSATDPGVDAMKAHLGAQLAQDLQDRAAVTADKAEAEKLKKDAKQLAIDAATPAQRAFKAQADDAGANLAMAEVLRLQGKATKDVKRYLDTAKAKASTGPGEWKREIALAEALLAERDGKLDDAKTAFAAIDTGDDKLESSGDVRARFHLALVAYLQNKPVDAKPLADQILAAEPDHPGAKALAARLATTVVKSDPLPPEDNNGGTKTPAPPQGGNGGGSVDTSGGGTYDSLLARANKLAETNCTKASELYQKALEQKPNGVEALTGMGYCHIDAKQFASAFSKFRAALAASPRYEPALWGIAEAYTQQGRKEQAIESVRAYLEVYPNAPKALKALDRLGAGAAPTPPTQTPTQPDNGAGSGSAAPAPTPPAPTPTPPAPTPAPATPESGAGSGSG